MKTTNISILATTDLHGYLPYELTSYIAEERSKEKNTFLVDAGDFFSIGKRGLPMNKYFDVRYSDDKYNYEYLEVPIAKEMKDIGYDAVILGNHEFIENNKIQLDNMISDFKSQGVEVLSSNTYKANGENYVNPYLVKDIQTDEGSIKLGILGLTIQEVGQKYESLKNGEVKAISEGLKDFQGYDGSLYQNDLVEEAKKWVRVMKDNDVDIIVAVVHSGEESKESIYPGNRIQELATEVEGIDAIVAGHTHKSFGQHDYKNKYGENVIVTQAGKYGECISKINLQLKKNKGKWDVVNKSSQIIKFEKSEVDKNAEKFIENVSTKLIERGDLVENEINLSDITPFKWDKAYIFEPKTSPDKIYETIGYEWQDIKEANSEEMIQMIFIKDKKVICHLYGYEKYLQMYFKFDKSEYKDSVITIYPRESDRFKVIIDKRWKSAYFYHI